MYSTESSPSNYANFIVFLEIKGVRSRSSIPAFDFVWSESFLMVVVSHWFLFHLFMFIMMNRMIFIMINFGRNFWFGEENPVLLYFWTHPCNWGLPYLVDSLDREASSTAFEGVFLLRFYDQLSIRLACSCTSFSDWLTRHLAYFLMLSKQSQSFHFSWPSKLLFLVSPSRRSEPVSSEPKQSWIDARLHFLFDHMFLHFSEVEQFWSFLDFWWELYFEFFASFFKFFFVSSQHFIFSSGFLIFDFVFVFFPEVIKGGEGLLIVVKKVSVFFFMSEAHFVESSFLVFLFELLDLEPALLCIAVVAIFLMDEHDLILLLEVVLNHLNCSRAHINKINRYA